MTRSGGRLNIVNAQYAKDEQPIDQRCECYSCQHFSRAYIRHLIISKEMLSATLLSIHNLHTMISLAAEIRQSILVGNFEQFASQFHRVHSELNANQGGD